MTVYYLDTSAAVKRYVNESGSVWIRNITSAYPHHFLISSRLLVVEIASALARRLRDKLITRNIHRVSLQALDDDCRLDYQLIELTDDIVNLARNLVGRHPLRAYDAVHLASALNTAQFLHQAKLPAPIFLSADDRLIQAAQKEGLAAENPSKRA